MDHPICVHARACVRLHYF